MGTSKVSLERCCNYLNAEFVYKILSKDDLVASFRSWSTHRGRSMSQSIEDFWLTRLSALRGALSWEAGTPQLLAHKIDKERSCRVVKD